MRWTKIDTAFWLLVLITILLIALAGCQSSVDIKGGTSTASAITDERSPTVTTQSTKLRIGSAPSPETRTSTLRIWIPTAPTAASSPPPQPPPECTK